MNKKLKVAAVTLSSFLLFGSIFGLAQNLYREYKTGDYVKEEDAYFGERITNPAGLIKASKYIVPSDGEYSKQKTRSLDTSLIGNIESVWNSYTGKGTTIAVIDDGFDYKHPEYVRSDGTSAISKDSRYYYANSDGTACLYKNYDTDSSCIAEDWEKVDVNEYAWATHGTNTSTTAAAPLNDVGGVGIAPDADILALKIDMSFAAIEGAIDYAISQKVDVINMSLGAYAENFTDGWGDAQEGDSSVALYLEEVCKKAYNAGIIVVAAAGNESTYHKSYPACNSNVIGVGAIGDYDNKGNASKLAEFTNYVDPSQTGEVNVDILAPGYVYTATQSGTKNSITHIYEDTQGTSFSSPIVAGAACLWKQKYPNGTPSQFLNQLQSTADDIGTYKNKMIPLNSWDSRLSDVGPSNITNGRLNVANLMKIDEPFVSVQQTSINLAVNEKIKVNLETANGTITYASSNADVAKVDGNGLIEGVSEGNANIIVTATKNGKTATASVPVKVSPFVATSSLSVDPSSVKLTVGDTYDMEKTVIVTPSDASRLFLYESQDDKIASVDIDTGLVTAIGEGTTTIDVIAPYGDGSASLLVTVEAPITPTTWDKVTSQTELTDGDYLIVCDGQNVAFNGGADNLNISNTLSLSVSNNKIIYDKTTEAAKFTIESYSGGYSIKSSSGKYISGTSGSNVLNSNTSAQKNDITISNGDADIVSNTSHLRFNSNNKLFRYYKSTTYNSQEAIQLYKASSAGGGSINPTVDSVTITPNSLSLDIHSNPSAQLKATVNGTNSPNQSVTWSSKNSSIATVTSDGLVKAISKGTTVISATSKVDPTKTGTCSITVIDSTPVVKSLSSITISNQITSLKVGDEFSFGGKVFATYSDSSTSEVTSSCSFSGYNMSKEGTYNVIVSYTYNGVTKTASYQLNVTNGTSQETNTGTFTLGWGAARGEVGTYSNFTGTSGKVKGLLDFDSLKNNATSAPAYNSNNDELRLYYGNGNGCSIKITPATGIVITGFVMTTSTSPSVNYFVNGGSAVSVTSSSNKYSATNLDASKSLEIKNVNKTNTQLKIKTIELTYKTASPSDTLSNVNLTCDKSFHPGESITKSDIKMSLVYSSGKTIETTEFNFADYMFTYEDALSGGTISKKQFNITYEGKQYNLGVSVSRLAFDETLKSASNVANFIMYEDNANQCTSKLDLAISYLNELSSDEKNAFSTSTDYVISTARNRLEAWARHEGKTLSFVDNAFVASSLRNQPSFNKNNEVIVIAILGLATVLAVATGIVLLKRKKEH